MNENSRSSHDDDDANNNRQICVMNRTVCRRLHLEIMMMIMMIASWSVEIIGAASSSQSVCGR